MRILVINYEFPPVGGGAGGASAAVAHQLAASGHQVTVLTSGFRGLPREEERSGVRIVRIPVMRKQIYQCTVKEMASFTASALVHAPRLARAVRPEWGLAFFGIPCGPVALHLKRTMGIPYLVSLRGGDVPGFLPEDLTLYHLVTRRLILKVWGEADRVAANGTRLQGLARAAAPDIPVENIPNGVDTQVFHPDGSSRDDSSLRLLFVGRLARQKNVEDLLRAIPHVRAHSSRPIRLDIVGDGPLRSPLEHLTCQLGLQDTVRFLGWKPREEIAERYRAAHLFCLPSLDEGLPNAMLEAVYSGLSVVTPRFVADQFTHLQSPKIHSYVKPGGVAQAILEALESPFVLQSTRPDPAHHDWSRVARYYLPRGNRPHSLDLSLPMVTAR